VFEAWIFEKLKITIDHLEVEKLKRNFDMGAIK
jgi:hypothetical protein